MRRLQQSTSRVVMLKVYLASDHVSPATGKTVAIVISKNGGAFANPNAGATNATEVSNGWYKVTLDTTDTGTVGDLVVRGTAAACDDSEQLCQVQGGFEQTGDSFARLGAPAGASVSADIATVATYIDTEVAAIKAKTDGLPSDPADASDIAGSFGTVNATLATIAGYIDTEVAAIKAKTDNLPAAPAAVADIPTANANADALLDRANGIETGLTLRNAIRLKVAALAGKVSGAGTASETVRNAVADSKNRLVFTVDASGNRTAVTTDLT